MRDYFVANKNELTSMYVCYSNSLVVVDHFFPYQASTPQLCVSLRKNHFQARIRSAERSDARGPSGEWFFLRPNPSKASSNDFLMNQVLWNNLQSVIHYPPSTLYNSAMLETIKQLFSNLHNLQDLIHWGGYTLLFVIVFSETGLLIGFFMTLSF